MPAAEHSRLEGGGSAAPGPGSCQSTGGAPAAKPPTGQSLAQSGLPCTQTELILLYPIGKEHRSRLVPQVQCSVSAAGCRSQKAKGHLQMGPHCACWSAGVE